MGKTSKRRLLNAVQHKSKFQAAKKHVRIKHQKKASKVVFVNMLLGLSSQMKNIKQGKWNGI